MTIVGIADIHGRIEGLRQISMWLSEADLVLVSGDVTNFGGAGEAEKVVQILQTCCRKVYLVPGNCDYPEVGEYLSKKGINLHRNFIQEGNLIIAGVGGSLQAPGRTPNEYTEENFTMFLKELENYMPQGKPVILLSHQPPSNTRCDLTYSRLHVGSTSVRNFIERIQPSICLTGHIHESRGIDSIGKTIVINPGPLRDRVYMYAELEGMEKKVQLMKGGNVLDYSI